jgi:hypothetical protein
MGKIKNEAIYYELNIYLINGREMWLTQHVMISKLLQCKLKVIQKFRKITQVSASSTHVQAVVTYVLNDLEQACTSF